MTEATKPAPAIKNFRVSSTANIVELSDALYNYIFQNGVVGLSITAGGPHAVNQMTKALILTRSRMSLRGKSLTWFSYFVDVPGDKDGKMMSLIQNRFELKEEVD